MHAGRAGHLGQADDGVLHFLGGHHHQIAQFINDDDIDGQLFIRMQGVVALQIPGVAIGKEFIAPRHLADRPVKGARRLFGVGDDGLLQVRNAVVDVELHHLGVDHDELDLVGLGLIE